MLEGLGENGLETAPGAEVLSVEVPRNQLSAFSPCQGVPLLHFNQLGKVSLAEASA